MEKLFTETQAAITSESSVLIYGESGTGKELIAKAESNIEIKMTAFFFFVYILDVTENKEIYFPDSSFAASIKQQVFIITVSASSGCSVMAILFS